ncbi:lanthionine synthetase LanC family protein [Pseudonocardia sp. CA-107938]|uniref:lanthionine synthetase LanC family protein n=1 Tax=Pseudonocardia sp. CA-107938 TaxID=3240021 RepID=UPI003D94F23B
MDSILDTAHRLRADATAHAATSADYAVHLDVAMAATEFERVLGEPFGAAAAWRRAVELLRAAPSIDPWLYRGAAQVAWVARRRGMGQVAALDDCVARWIDAYPAWGTVDLPRGLLGLGVSAAEHPDGAVRDKLTSRVLDVIEDRTVLDADGRHLPAAPRGVGHLLGLAHGAAGLVAYLAAVSATDLPCRLRAADLLDAVTGWLLAQRHPVGGSVFPRSVETRDVPARSAWCHGDPGIWIGLAAAAAAGSAAAAAVVDEVAHAVVTRPPEHAGVVDATVCHGSAGLLWIAHRMHVATGDPAAAARVEHWMRHIRAERAAGPLRYFGGAGMVRNASFLEGDLGVALVLLAVATGTRPAWERLLLGGEVGR